MSSTSPTVFDISNSSATTRITSPHEKIKTIHKLLSTNNINYDNINANKSPSPTSFKKAPWRVPGNFEIPDIIKEAWEKNKDKVLNSKILQPNKVEPIVVKKRWIPVGKPPSIIPLLPPIPKVCRKLHPEFNDKLRKVLPGSKILNTNPKDQFEDLLQVGSGANGAVVRATRKYSKTQVAIKRCYIEDQDTPHHAYILRELRIMGRLSHPNLIQIKEACLWDDYLWMCMELMSCSVFNLLYNTTAGLSEPNAVRVAKEVLEGLVYLHSKNYIHRDIKCENILLNRNGQVKLADFGLATPINKLNTARLGTAKWMAPEVVSESPYKENVDIWSLAITIIEMMDRVPPLYYLENSEDIYYDILNGDPPTFRFSIPSEGMTNLIQWMSTHNGMTRPGAKAVLKRIHADIKNNLLKCSKQKEIALLVRKVFPDT